MDGTPQSPEDLAPQECLRLLGSVPVGRLVFTTRALPAIRPACHVIDGSDLIIGSDADVPAFASAGPGLGPVLAYQADAIDPLSRLGWSVVVVGLARRVTDPDRVAGYQRSLAPWVAGTRGHVIVIPSSMITGFRLAAADGSHREGTAVRPGTQAVPEGGRPTPVAEAVDRPPGTPPSG